MRPPSRGDFISFFIYSPNHPPNASESAANPRQPSGNVGRQADAERFRAVSFNVHAGTYQLTNVDASFAKFVSARFNAREIEQIANEFDLPVTLDGDRLCVIQLFFFSDSGSL